MLAIALVLGVVGIGILTNLGLLFWLVLCLVWLIYLFVRTSWHFVRWNAGLPTNSVTQKLAWLNVCFLVGSAGTIGFGLARLRTIDHWVQALSSSPAADPVYQVVIPRIIRLGTASIDPLIAACDRAVSKLNRRNNTIVVSRASFCLAKIGGPRAEEYLALLVREHVDFSKGVIYSSWAHDVCFAYAECAGARAAPALLELYERQSPGRWHESRYAVLIALVKTGASDGVLFTLDHINELLKLDYDDVDDYDSVAAVLEGLIRSQNTEELRTLPVYSRLLFGGLDHVPLATIRHSSRSQLMELLSSKPKLKSRDDTVSQWNAVQDDTIRRWREQFETDPIERFQ